MATPELKTVDQVADVEILNPTVRASHDVPLCSLLGEENQENPISEDRLSIYAVNRLQGTEYVVAFPALDGTTLYDRLTSISKTSPGIQDVATDIRLVLSNYAQLGDHHRQYLGPIWTAFYHSLEHQRGVFVDGIRNGRAPESKPEEAQALLQLITDLQGTPPNKFTDLYRTKQEIKDMLEGKIPLNASRLTSFFHLSEDEVRKTKEDDEPFISRKAARRAIKRKGKPSNIAIVEPYVLKAAQKKAFITNDEGNTVYNEKALNTFASRITEPPLGQIRYKLGSDFYLLPKDQYRLLHHSQHSNCVSMTLTEDGNFSFAEDSYALLKVIASGKHLPHHGKLVVPVIRFLQTKNGVTRYIFHDTEDSPDLPPEVVEDIGRKVDESKLSKFPFENSWISGSVGIDMLLSAHPSIRLKEDNWSQVWNQRNITYSQVSGEETTAREKKQFNGPIQATIIALHAFARYPGDFDHFRDKVIETSQKAA